jgi:hypothetical protein
MVATVSKQEDNVAGHPGFPVPPVGVTPRALEWALAVTEMARAQAPSALHRISAAPTFTQLTALHSSSN